jgi:hypothetical protein
MQLEAQFGVQRAQETATMIQMSPFATAPGAAIHGRCKTRLRKIRFKEGKAECAAQPYCFISYARKDEETVRRFLQAAHVKQDLLWIDRKKLEPGGRWSADIVSAIRRAAGVIVFCSHRAFRSHDVFREVALAGRFDQPIIPVFIDDATAPDEFLYYLSIHEAIRVSEPDCIERLHKALEAFAPTAAVDEKRAKPIRRLFRTLWTFAWILTICVGLWLFFLTGGPVSASEWKAVQTEPALDPLFEATNSVCAHAMGLFQPA